MSMKCFKKFPTLQNNKKFPKNVSPQAYDRAPNPQFLVSCSRLLQGHIAPLGCHLRQCPFEDHQTRSLTVPVLISQSLEAGLLAPSATFNLCCHAASSPAIQFHLWTSPGETRAAALMNPKPQRAWTKCPHMLPFCPSNLTWGREALPSTTKEGS